MLIFTVGTSALRNIFPVLKFLMALMFLINTLILRPCNKSMSMLSPVQIDEGRLGVPEICYEGFVEKVGFEPGVKG